MTVNRFYNYSCLRESHARELSIEAEKEGDLQAAVKYNDIIYEEVFNLYMDLETYGLTKDMKPKIVEKLEVIAQRGIQLIQAQLKLSQGGTA